jgi:integrase
MSSKKPNRIHFIKRTLDTLALPEYGKRVDYYDEQQRNLLIRLTSNGGKTFYVRRKIGSVSERILVGRYPDLSIEQARKKAALILAEIAQGSNPQEIKRQKNQEPTVEDIFNNYIEGHAKARCIRLKDMQRDFELYFTDWRNRKCSTIRRPDVQTKVNYLYKHNGAGGANHAIILMKAAVNWNIKHGFLSGENPWTSVKTFRMQARERFLLPHELQGFFTAVNKLKCSSTKDFIMLSLLTGARRSNVLSMRWEQIDFDLGIWRIPLTKNGESQTVPLTGPALQILSARHNDQEAGWVLPGKLPGSHLVEPKWTWKCLLKDAGISNLRMHDLRRTLASYMAIGNQSLQIIGKALGHKSTQATQIYARLTHDPVRKAMEQAQSDILTAAGISPNLDNIVHLPEAKQSTDAVQVFPLQAS